MIENDNQGNYEPPRKEDILFCSDNEMWHANACLGNLATPHAYSQGYRKSARILSEYVYEKGRHQDFLIYPIVFLYRHHIELILKQLIIQGSDLANIQLTSKAMSDMKFHQINQLWANFKPILSKVCKDNYSKQLPTKDIKGIDSYINQLSTVDLDGVAFRFSKNKEGQPSLPDDLQHINIAIFSDHMEKLCEYLENIDYAFSHLEDCRSEMLASMDFDRG